jgi:hypothetical protein
LSDRCGIGGFAYPIRRQFHIPEKAVETSQNVRFFMAHHHDLTRLIGIPVHKLYKTGMVNSLFISCELQRPDKNYDRIVAAIESVGEPWTQVQFTLWYLKTKLSAGQVRDRIKPALDKSDQLVVIDATNNRMASINLRAEASKQLYDQGFLKVT